MNVRLLSALLLLAAPAALLAQDKADWTQFRGPKGLGVSAAKGLPTTWSEKENLAWKVKLPGPGSSSPIVFGERIYLVCYSGYNVPGEKVGSQDDLRRHLVCLKKADGELVWNTPVKAELPEQANIRDSHGYASSTPAADKDHVYCFFGKSGVHAFTHDGKPKWQADVGSKLHGWGSATSPVLSGDLVIVNASVESESLFAFDRKTGKEKWRVKGIKESWNTPVLVPVDKDRTDLVVAVFGKLLGLDPATGKERWSCKTDITWYVVPSIVFDDKAIYCLGGRSGVAGVAVKLGGEGDVTKSHRLWTSQKGANVSSPVLHDGHLYWVNESRGTAYCAEAKTGEVVYEERLVGRFDVFYPSAILADGKLFYLSRDGQMVVLAAKPKYEKLATNDLRDRSLFHASPVVSGSRLLIRSDKHLYCVEKK